MNIVCMYIVHTHPHLPVIEWLMTIKFSHTGMYSSLTQGFAASPIYFSTSWVLALWFALANEYDGYDVFWSLVFKKTSKNAFPQLLCKEAGLAYRRVREPRHPSQHQPAVLDVLT